MHDYTFSALLEIMKRLRRDCPWDREQTNDSIKGHTIEEAFEVVEAIDEGDDRELRSELGDLLLHVVFHAQIAEDEGRFSIDDVLQAIIEKLVRRHPHIFGDVEVRDSSDVKRNWEQIKMDEGGRESVIDGVPKALPALLKAHRLQDKASKVGFDWNDRRDVWNKVLEEVHELEEVVKRKDREGIEDEFGDVLFSLVNYARFLNVNPEDALRKTITKFSHRFRYLERRMKEEGKDIEHSSLEEMDVYWEEAKSSGIK